jgi:hypothetical protein
MKTKIVTVALDRLLPHPDNPNHMSKPTFARLVRSIEQTGLYEPLIVRPAPNRKGFYQIINGHHRYQALQQLGYANANVIVWNVDDEQTDVLLATLNRLGGRDTLDKKLTLLRRTIHRTPACDLAKRLPYTATQLERLTARVPARVPGRKTGANVFAIPMVFYVSAEQQKTIEDALTHIETSDSKGRSTQRAQALAQIASAFINRREVRDDE